ncbi:unnamed protein product [Diatraea saccharalis]|uniref:RRM domain-containing protein n=1 Tax=Diatraea saccharalis TaxID=40085 RepID=A0A9N9RG06_9NEOP|nr:unnamed protein product [Diatraea saccharalis]
MSSTRLFVGNLPDTVTETDISTVFSNYGHIVNVDFKNKSDSSNNQKHFAFVTISASNYEIESCIKHFSTEDFHGQRLFVTRARESFLERLQRERQEAQNKEAEKNIIKQEHPKKNVVLKLSDKLNPRKRKLDTQYDSSNKVNKPFEEYKNKINTFHNINTKKEEEVSKVDKKKQEADKKRMESIKRKTREFKEKQKIIKTGLVGIDIVANKKVIFSDSDDDSKMIVNTSKSTITKEKNCKNLFDDNESGDEVNFEIKQQFEGKKGQKVLDLQSRYKSDKRFILDERFIEDGESEEEEYNEAHDNEDIDLGNADEKTKQLNILEDVLGVSIKPRTKKLEEKKYKSKLGMFRYDPLQPEHAKFLAPIEQTNQESTKKTKKKKSKENQEEQNMDTVTVENDKLKIEVSKEQFYKVSETLKESLDQPINFSLRSLFGNKEESERVEQETSYISIEKPKEPRIKNPLNPSDKNPFIYDSSDSEMEDEVHEVKKEEISTEATSAAPETKILWKENLFFSASDSRLLDGLAFFNNTDECVPHKERRELKAVMKKRIYNKDRKSQMFQKKIGGRKKSMKKTYKKKSNMKN